MIKALRIAVMIFSLLLILAGIFERQPLSVLSKAVRICLECVGIG